MRHDRQRVDQRYRASIPVRVLGRKVVSCHTLDVSFGGMSLACELQPRVSELLRLEVSVPGEPEPLRMHAEVRHRSPGVIGMRFYGIGDELRARWVKWVAHVRDSCGDAAPRSRAMQGTVASSAADAELGVVLELRPRTTRDLVRLYARDVPMGGTVIETDQRLAPGTRVYLIVHHPESGSVFGLRAAVRRAVEQGAAAAVAVELLDMDPGRRRAFREFIETGAQLSMRTSAVVASVEQPLYPPPDALH